MKKPKGTEKEESLECLESEVHYETEGCSNCSKKYLRGSWLAKHVETCNPKKEQKRKIADEV
jgi:hypothetical protein